MRATERIKKVLISGSVVRVTGLKNINVLQPTNVEILSPVRHDQFHSGFANMIRL